MIMCFSNISLLWWYYFKLKTEIKYNFFFVQGRGSALLTFSRHYSGTKGLYASYPIVKP